ELEQALQELRGRAFGVAGGQLGELVRQLGDGRPVAGSQILHVHCATPLAPKPRRGGAPPPPHVLTTKHPTNPPARTPSPPPARPTRAPLRFGRAPPPASFAIQPISPSRCSMANVRESVIDLARLTEPQRDDLLRRVHALQRRVFSGVEPFEEYRRRVETSG